MGKALIFVAIALISLLIIFPAYFGESDSDAFLSEIRDAWRLSASCLLVGVMLPLLAVLSAIWAGTLSLLFLPVLIASRASGREVPDKVLGVIGILPMLIGRISDSIGRRIGRKKEEPSDSSSSLS